MASRSVTSVVIAVLFLCTGIWCRDQMGRKTVTFHRNQQDDSELRQVRSRARRDNTGTDRNTTASTTASSKGSQGPAFTSCRRALSQTEHEILDDNTHETGFNGDDGSSFILTWVGDGTGVILVLSTISAPIDSFLKGGSSRLYRSMDYGKSFRDVSHRIDHTFIRKEFGVTTGPGNSFHVILTADTPVVDNSGGIVFTSSDAGVTFRSVRLPFHLAQPIAFHFLIPDYLVAISIDGGLWLSVDFGANWRKVHDGAHSFMWGAGVTLFFSYSPVGTVEADRRGELLLKRTEDLGMTFTTIAEEIFSFGYIGGFLITSVMDEQWSPRVIYVSSDQGNSFNRAQLPSATTEQFYSILDGDEVMIFIHVDNPGDTYFGTMYTSDDRGILYSRSLERHLFGGQRKSDFTNVTSLRGVYLTNKLEEDGRIRTVISFDRGGQWRLMGRPGNAACGDVQNCNLHIHGEHSRYNQIVPMLPLSEPSAIGLVIAHGVVGDSLSATQHPDVFISSDGGYRWRGALEGPHHYRILDSGALVVAVEAQHEGQVKTIKFSTDEGQCWKAYNFTEHPLFFAGLTSEPGTKAMNISVWGYRPEDDGQPMWVAVTIDFTSILSRQCNSRDYEEWLAHSSPGGDPETNGCVMGYKETYRRLKKSSVCRNGRDYGVRKKQSPCPCTREDYLCDYGYLRRNDSSECVRQPNTADPNPEVCLNGGDEEIQTFGYRKVPGDKCEGGFTPQPMSEIIRPCGNKLSEASPANQLSPATHFDTPREKMVLILVVAGAGFIVLVAVVSAALTVRRNRNRTPTYRFSNLRVQDEGLTPDPDGTPRGHGALFHHHDSDDVSASPCLVPTDLWSAGKGPQK
ncbi:sortilin isoform X1 [Gadus chalcogrammus]|uniref:sortilin isoform X1 n=1 Tax=Gadus chalcogrammus TaxID=1042646 RepID=UPI0024C4A398|nr:sortilin isoform X1 [Gadus chalcogrammus]